MMQSSCRNCIGREEYVTGECAACNLDISLLLPFDGFASSSIQSLSPRTLNSGLLPAFKRNMQCFASLCIMPTPIMLPHNCNSLANGILLVFCQQLCWLDVDGRLGPLTRIPHMLPARLQVESLHREKIACVQMEGHLQPNIGSHCSSHLLLIACSVQRYERAAV